jgi:hypothetical protein
LRYFLSLHGSPNTSTERGEKQLFDCSGLH